MTFGFYVTRATSHLEKYTTELSWNDMQLKIPLCAAQRAGPGSDAKRSLSESGKGTPVGKVEKAKTFRKQFAKQVGWMRADGELQ